MREKTMLSRRDHLGDFSDGEGSESTYARAYASATCGSSRFVSAAIDANSKSACDSSR